MTLIHPSVQPATVVDAAPAELEWLTLWGLVYSLGIDLHVTYLTWSDGPPYGGALTATATILDNTPATVGGAVRPRVSIRGA